MLKRDGLRTVGSRLLANTTITYRACIVVALLLGAMTLACGPLPELFKATAPTLNPPAGTYSSAQSVAISATTPGAVIHCTTDGSSVTAQSPVCTTVDVTTSTTIRAIATATGYTDSDVVTATYTIGSTLPKASAPTFNPPSGASATSSLTVTLSSTTANATIRCTTDNSSVTAQSPVCTTVNVTTSTTIRAIATATGYTDSDVVTATYTIGSTPGPTPSTPWIMGYYAGYYPAIYPPDKVNVQSMTHVIWARGAVGDGDWTRGDGQLCYPTTIAVGERVPPGSVCLAAGPWGNQTLEPIVEKAHAAGRKVLIVIGGVGEGPTFVASTATSEVRNALAANLLDLLEAYDLDGVDIDWEDEIPAERGRQQFIPFVQRLRELAQARVRFGSASPLIVTVPWFTYQDQETAAPDAWIVDLAKLVDRINMMSYGVGIANPWSGWATWHSGALFGPNGPGGSHTTANGEVGSLERAVQQYVGLGIPREKVGIGVGFYAFAWGPPSVKPADQPASANPAPLWALGDADEQTWYKNLPLTQGTYVWDDTAKMGYRVYSPPFVLGAGEQVSWWSYEDERSLAAKVDWLQAGNAGGMIIWMINYGCTNPDTGENVLLQAIQNAMGN